MTQYPQIIKQILQQTKEDLFEVTFCLSGEKVKVLVIDLFSCKKTIPAISQSKSKDIWVLIIEKAWATVSGSYENTVSGNSLEALRALTGAPTKYFDHEKIEHVWKDMVRAKNQGFIICCSVGEEGESEDKVKSKGLVDDHAYAIISVYDVEGNKLIEMYNPWGKKEWQGDWSKNSEKWTPELRKKLGVTEEENGIFFMCYEDYMNFFRSTTICMVN